MKFDLRKLVQKETVAQVTKIKQNLVEALRRATPVDTGEARDGWRVEGDKIVNDVPHIKQLNEGSSQQAPARFVEQTLLSQRGVSPRGTIVKS